MTSSAAAGGRVPHPRPASSAAESVLATEPPARPRRVGPLEIAILAILGVAAELVIKGYQFGISDQNDELPLIRRVLDPTFLSHDWFVNAASGPFDARRGYAWLMALPVRVLGEPVSFWLVFTATIVVLTLGMMCLAQGRGWRLGAGFTAAFIVIANDQGSLGLSTLVLPLLVPSIIAWTLLVWGWVALERRRPILFGLACGAAALVHPLIGSGGFGLLILWSWLRTHHLGLRESALAAAAFCVPAFPSVWPIVEAHLTADTSAALESVRIMTTLRGPWHYVPSTWPIDEWIGFLSFLTLVVVIVRPGRDDNPIKLGALVLLMDLVAIAAVEVFPVPLIDKLQLFRLTVFIQVIGALLIGKLADELLDRRRPLEAVALVTLVIGATLLDPRLLIICCALAAMIRFEPSWPRLARATPALAVTALLMTAEVALVAHNLRVVTGMAVFLSGIGVIEGARRDWLGRPTVRRALFAALTSIMVIAAQLVAFGLVTLPARASAFAAPVSEEMQYSGSLDDIAQWAARSSPTGAIFLVPPYYDSFRVRASRAEVVDFKAFAFDDRAILDWYSRLQLVTGRHDLRLGYGFDQELRQTYDAEPLTALIAVARRYGATYVVVPNRALTPTDRPIYRNVDYAVMTLP